MADLRGALLAAAEEAEKLQKDLELERTRILILDEHVAYLEKENNALKTKFRQAGELMRHLAILFDSEEVL